MVRIGLAPLRSLPPLFINSSPHKLPSSLASHNPSRRLALLHLGTAIPQAKLLQGKASTLIRADGKSTEIIQASTNVTQEGALEWANKDKRRLLQVVYRVGNLDKTIKFYTKCLGMKLLRKRDIPEEKYLDAFLGYGPEDSNFAVELTYNYGVDKYEIGSGFGHFGIATEDAFGMKLLRKGDNPEYKYTIAMMGYGPEDQNTVLELTCNYGVKEYDKGNDYAQIAIGTDDVYKTTEAIKLYGGEITREPGRLPGINTKITVCVDPDGWKSVFVDNIDFAKELGVIVGLFSADSTHFESAKCGKLRVDLDRQLVWATDRLE